MNLKKNSAPPLSQNSGPSPKTCSTANSYKRHGQKGVGVYDEYPPTRLRCVIDKKSILEYDI